MMFYEKSSYLCTRFPKGKVSGCSAVGSASGLGPEGRTFESCHPDEKEGATRINSVAPSFFYSFRAEEKDFLTSAMSFESYYSNG